MPGATPLTRSPAAANPAPAAKPTPARAVPATATVTATTTPAQGGPPAVRIGANSKAGDAAPGVLELKGMSDFKPPAPLAEFLDAHKTSIINVRFSDLAQGPLQVKTVSKGKYRIKKQPLPLAHPAFARIADFVPSLAPALIIGVDDSRIVGEVGLAAGEKVERISHYIQKTPDMLGLAGFTIGTLPTIVNTIEGGSLHLGLKGVPIKLGSAFSGKFNFDVVDTTVSFDGSAAVAVKGLANGTLDMKREASGLITGKAVVGLVLGKSISGNFDVAWDGVAITGLGKVGYKGEKFSGEVTLQMMEKNQAEQLAKAKKAPPGAAPTPAPSSNKTPAKIEYVVFGEGNLGFSFTPWLNGTAQVIIDPKGNLTVIGELKPQKEFNLFNPPQKDYVKELFKLEIHATYGLPPIADVFIFASIGMDLFAKLGPARLYDIIIKGTYSTDPTVAKNFSIGGTFNLSAAAGVRLRIEAGAGLEILGHDIKAGAGINGIAGIKAYAKAEPVVGYREKAVEGQDMKGEWFISGTLEMAAQPFLGLSGDLFVELETPWWSPLSDDKWTWPLFSKEWPLGGVIGMLVSVEHVFGSGELPKFDLKPLKEFNSEDCVTELYKDKAKSGSGKEVEQKAQWGERNTPSANPPPKTPQPGNLKPGKAAAQPKAKPKKVAKTKGKPATPDAKTKGGKDVKQLQAEAQKKGKGPKDKPTDLTKTKPGDRTDAQKKVDLAKGLLEADMILHDEQTPISQLKKKLAPIKTKYRMTSLDFVVVTVNDKEGTETVQAVGEINPKDKSKPEPHNLRQLVSQLEPINYRHRGHVVTIVSGPLKGTSVTYDALGFPDFSPFAIKTVTITMHGNRTYTVPDGDFGNANEKAGYDRNGGEPKGHTWHHHQDRKTMQLVKTKIHDAFRHSGGVWVVDQLGEK